jgi:hypothetical protein
LGSRLSRELKPYRTAAECIDWQQPMLSIFATRAEARTWAAAVNVGREKADRVGIPQRPLKPKTQKRIAGGLDKWVLKASEPFIINIANYGWDSSPHRSVIEPLDTVTPGRAAASTQRWTSNSLPTPALSITAARSIAPRTFAIRCPPSPAHAMRAAWWRRAVPVHGPAPRRARRASAALALDRAAASDRHRRPTTALSSSRSRSTSTSAASSVSQQTLRLARSPVSIITHFSLLRSHRSPAVPVDRDTPRNPAARTRR